MKELGNETTNLVIERRPVRRKLGISKTTNLGIPPKTTNLGISKLIHLQLAGEFFRTSACPPPWLPDIQVADRAREGHLQECVRRRWLLVGNDWLRGGESAPA